MDKRDAARRVRALRAKALADGTTAPERASLNAKANELEQKYGKIEPPVSYPSVTSNPGWKDREEFAEAVMRMFNEPMFKAPGPRPPDLEPDDLIEDTYLFQYSDEDDDDPSY